ncbi:hypothetical protein HZS_6602 [Henneguya salminicola]|nr:hypothetical protein HZS_6602 [Henneguya salminicola]
MEIGVSESNTKDSCDFFLKKNHLLIQTNNALERYNRRIKELFAAPYPNIFTFLQVIKDEARYKEKLLNNIFSGSEPFPRPAPFVSPHKPESFLIFRKN